MPSAEAFNPSSKLKKLNLLASRFPIAFAKAWSRLKTEELVLEEVALAVVVLDELDVDVILLEVVEVVLVVETIYHAVGVLRVVGTAPVSF